MDNQKRMTAESNHRLPTLLRWEPGVPLVVLSWALACCAFEAISAVSLPVLALPALGAWICAMHMRLNRTREHDKNYELWAYLLLLAALGITVWIACCRVGQAQLDFYFLPIILFAISRLCKGAILQHLGSVLQSFALAMICAAPAFQLNFTQFPIHLFFCVPVWNLGLFFYIAAWERTKICNGASNHIAPVICTVMILITSLYCSQVPNAFASEFYATLAMGCGCLLVAAMFYKRFSQPAALLLNWLAISIPAVVGVLLCAPPCWY